MQIQCYFYLWYSTCLGFEKVADILHLHTGGSIASVVGKHGKTASMHAAERGKNILYLTQF